MGYPIRLAVFICALTAALSTAAPAEAAPSVASLNTVLAREAPTTDVPPFSVIRWDRFPSILIIDTADSAFQDRMFSRLAFFLEKRGFRGRLLDNTELSRLHGWNAHDYGPQGLASFFNAAQRIDFPLNPEEIALRDLALEEGIINVVRDRFEPGAGGVLSISRSSSRIERRLLLTHESFHGIFFASADYRAFCFQLWDALDPQTRRFFTRVLDELGYDAGYRYLAVNEFQAYLMQQPLRYAPEYFERVAHRFSPGGNVPVGAIENAARRLDGYLESRFGIRAGGTVTAGGPSGGTE